MKITREILENIWTDAGYINLEKYEKFDFVNISKISDANPEDERHLFFAIYDTHPEIEGWYLEPIDRRKFFPKITLDKPHWTFVIEQDVDISAFNPDAKIIVVKNILESINLLYGYVFNTVNPKICGVTGSVGKTTTASLLEEIISSTYNCLRIYSKRITPLIIYTTIINKLDLNIEWIILEYGLYRKDHITKLVKLLPPNVSIIMNIKKMHVGTNGINSLQEILDEKSKIIIEGSIPILNLDDEYIRTICNSNAITFSKKRFTGNVYVISAKDEYLNIICCNKLLTIKPYLLTELSVYQALVGITVAHLLDISLRKAVSIINKTNPKEHRVAKSSYRGKLVIFDGDVSHSARLSELAKNFYSDTTLVVSKLDFSEEKVEYLVSDLLESFKLFSRVRILNDDINKNQFTGYELPVNTKFLPKAELIKDLPNESTIVLHYSKYFRIEGNSKLVVSNLLD